MAVALSVAAQIFMIFFLFKTHISPNYQKELGLQFCHDERAYRVEMLQMTQQYLQIDCVAHIVRKLTYGPLRHEWIATLCYLFVHMGRLVTHLGTFGKNTVILIATMVFFEKTPSK